MSVSEADGETAEEPAKERGPRVGSAREQRARRLAKVKSLRARGVEPYPYRFDRDRTMAELRAEFGHLAVGEETDTRVKVCGRVYLLRRHGGLIFADLHDQTGRFQLYASRETMGEQAFADFGDLDIGDWIGVSGTVMRTRTGEESVNVEAVELLSKAIRPLPNKARPLADVDTRMRQRYLDLIVDPETRRLFDIRHAALAAIRQFLASRGFVEVETPVLDQIAGGATARPFITHHNALDIDNYLRIALELHLKRLIVGGFERVFEMSRVFRNEGIDTRHNPEFTMLEAYQAFADYTDMMELTEELVAHAARESLGRTVVNLEGKTVDLAPPWRRATMAELIKEQAGVEASAGMPLEEARRMARDLEVEIEPTWGSGKIVDELYDVFVEEKLLGPIFVIDHPREVSPLAKPHRSDPSLVERFEVVVDGRELANAYSELNDPIDQRARFEDEARAKAAGDPEAGDVDEDYLRAMEYGLPPTGGLGIGIDRLVMLLTEKAAIREVLLFPTLRPEEGMALPPPRFAQRREPDKPAAPTRATAPLRLPPAPAKGPSIPAILGWLTGIAGVLSLLALLPGFHSGLGAIPQAFLPLTGDVASTLASVLIGVGLILVAHGIARRKKLAWWIAVGLFSAATVVHVLKGPHPVAAAVTAGMVAVLFWARREFTARTDPPSLFAAFWFVPLYLAIVLAYGVIVMVVKQDKIEPDLTVGGVLETVFGGLVGLDGPYTYSTRFLSEFFPASLLALGCLGLVILAYLVFRPIVQRHKVSEEEREHAGRLVREYGWDTLAYFALRNDKSLFFSSDGEAMIPYAYLRGYALVSADPIGAPESIDLVLDEFLGFCREQGWRVAFLAAREEEAPRYEARGLRTLYLGDEAIIRCDRFALQGQKMKKVREAVNRVSKSHQFRLVRESDAGPELVAALNAISENWRGKEPERGFTMSLSQDVEGRSDEILLAVASGPGGAPVGFLRLVPAFGPEPGYSLDVMRHDPEAQNGVTEFLIARSAEALKQRGIPRLSMNFAAWGRLFHAEGELSTRERIGKWIVDRVNPFFQIQSLYDFNAKFDPDWLPRVIVYEESTDLARVGILYAGVEGFLNVPVIGHLLVPQVVTEAGGAR
jgi:lysyl-tRNA synthetase